jgi:hypothetical protein
VRRTEPGDPRPECVGELLTVVRRTEASLPETPIIGLSAGGVAAGPLPLAAFAQRRGTCVLSPYRRYAERRRAGHGCLRRGGLERAGAIE